MADGGIALVTGGNKGIGFEICRQLARKGMTVLLGARDEARGSAAAAQLAGEGLDVRLIRIDMGKPETFAAAAQFIAETFGQLDVLVNNAGFGIDWAYKADTVPPEMIRETFETNFFGPVDLTQRLLPLIRRSPAGRIVNHSSGVGSLTLQGDAGSRRPRAFAYGASKTALNAFTVHLADALRDTPIKVNSAHPGEVKTDANPMGKMDAAEGARTAVELALLPPDGPTGGFFHLGRPLPW